MKFLSNIKNEWQKSILNKRFLVNLVLSLFSLVVVFMALSEFLQWIELRQGVILNDPFLNLFQSRDISWLTFSVIYFSVILAIIGALPKPKLFLIMIITYTIMIILRMIGMYFVGLNPPLTAIHLQDPIIVMFASGKIVTKDLFFSGHTATMFLFYYLTENKKIKGILLIGLIIVATGVLMQHVHYTIDVLVALVASYVACKMAQYISLKIN